MKKPNFTKTELTAKVIFCLLLFSGNLFASNFHYDSLNANHSICKHFEHTPPTLGISLSVQDPSCYSYTNGAIYTSVSGGVSPYFYIWDNDATDEAPHLLGVGAGTFSVTVTDSAGETITASADVVQPPDIIAEMTATDVFCSIGGTATVSCTGGVPPYTYLWDNGSTTTMAEDLQPGLISVYVTDNTGCVTIHTVAVGGTSSSSLSAQIIDQNFTSCALSSNGYAEVQGINGSGNYTYAWPNGQTTALATGLDVGTYEATVTDDTGCSVTASAIIELHPEGVFVAVTGTDASCNENDGQANTSVMLGSPPYSYQWNNNATTPNLTNLLSGNYTVTVTDSKGCTESASTFINQQASDLILFTTSSFETCVGSQDASATVVANGGNPPYTYQWSNGYNSYKNPDVAAGTYEVTVTDSDGCYMTASETVEISPEGVWVMLSGTNASCCGNDGTAHVSIMTGEAPFTIEWSDGQTATEDPINLAPGEICVTVTDSKGCSNTECITLVATEALSIDMVAVNASCASGNTGSATATPCSPGTFTYLWSNGQTSQTATNLANGDHQVTIQNSNGCTGVANVTVVNEGGNLALQINNSIDVSCFGANDGTASVTASGGSGNYSYQWSNGQTTQIATDLPEGITSVVITDNNSGCSGMASVIISQPAALAIDASWSDISCGGAADGAAIITPSGGTIPYTYLWSNNSTGSFNNNLSSGDYQVTATDANGCTATQSVIITEGAFINVSVLDLVQPSCFGESNGAASTNVIGGNAPYTFEWNNGVNTGTINGISAGPYSVTVTDANGCSGVASTTIDQPTAISIAVTSNDETCGGGNDGSATAIASGGTAPYIYLWNNGQSSSNLNNLAPGSYNLTLTDANGCSIVSSTTTVATGTSLNVTTSPSFVSCFAGSDGSIAANVSGGTGNYTYIWNTGATTSALSNLSTGTYMVTVMDDEACSGIASGIVLEPTELTVTMSGTDESCPDATNGEAYANASGGTAPYTYAWSTGENSPFLLNLSEGTYNVTVTDANNCTASGSFLINSNGITSCTAMVTSNYNEGVDISTLGGNDGTASADVSGATGSTTFTWSNGQTGSAISGLSAGTYTVTVADGSGCSCSASVTLMDPAKLGNFVWEDLNKNGIQDSGEPGIQGVQANLIGTSMNGLSVTRSGLSESTGVYIFDGLPAGSYQVTFDKPDGYNPTLQNVGSNETLDSDADEETGMTEMYDLDNGDYNSTIDAGYYGCVNIGDFVWYDSDKDGIQDSNNGGFPNVLVRLLSTGPDGIPCNADDFIVDFQTTNTAGNYLFECVTPGEYYVQFLHPEIPDTYGFSPFNQGNDDSLDSDVDPATGKTPIFTIVPGQPNNFSLDAGIAPNCNNITNGGMIGYTQVVCDGAAADTLVNTVHPDGGSGDLEYLWLKSLTGSSPVGGSDWEEIPNSNASYYSPGVLTETYFFARLARRAGCDDYSESNIVEIEVIPYDPDICGSSPMFITFTVNIINEVKDLELNWTTNEENDLYNFYIEYSSDNENFEVLGNMTGSGIGSTNNQYSFMDKSLAEGIHHYRIKAVGLQSIHYSEQLDVAIHDALGDLLLYPNPSNDFLNIEVEKTLQVDATIEIYNSIGQLIDELRMGTETTKLVYELSDLSIGTYFIRLKFDDSKESKIYKFLKR